MNGCVVYEHENLVNGKKYFGITTKKPEHRWGKGGSGYDYNEHFWRAIQKYGWSEGFSHKILFEGLSVAEACEIEEMLIADYKTQDPEHGYNLTSGGDHYHHSEESRRKMSGENNHMYGRTGEKHPNYGKTVSEETRRKLSESHKGNTHSEETRRKMGESIREALKNPETRRKMSESHKGEKNYFYGKHHSEETRRKLSEAQKGEKSYWWGKRHSEESLRKMMEAQPKKPVEAIDPETGLRVYYFKSINDARRAGFSASHISECCNGKTYFKTHKGYIWRFC